MNLRYVLLASCLMLPLASMAQEATPAPAVAPATANAALPAITDNAELDVAIRDLQNEWALIKYKDPDADSQLKKMKDLSGKAAQVSAKYPNYAEAKIWQAIIVSTQAGMAGGLGALDLCKQAKGLLEQAIKINGNALSGSAYTSLGSLYYKVPAWPVGFGDNEKAKAYMEQARAINPDGIDPNYFYGDFLSETGHAKEAVPILEHALQAPARPGREVADAGRREEINIALAKARKEAAE